MYRVEFRRLVEWEDYVVIFTTNPHMWVCPDRCFHSAHLRHVVRNIPYYLAHCIRGIVSNPAKVPIRMQQMKCRLKHKKFRNKLINDAIDKAMALPRRDIIDPMPKVQTTQVEDGHTKVYCVTTFDPKVSHPGNQLESLLERFNEGRTTEKEKFTVQSSFRKNPSLQQLLTFKKPDNSKGVFKFLSGCTLCKTLHEGPDLKLKSGKILKANARFECTSRNLVYAMICNGCGELYIGETGDTLRNRFACHRSQMALDYNEAPVPADPHVRICGKYNYIIFPFYKPAKLDTIHRRTHESFWIKKLKPKLNTLISRR